MGARISDAMVNRIAAIVIEGAPSACAKRIKIEAVKSRGATVVLHGDSYSDAYRKAMQLKRARGLTFAAPSWTCCA
jgi:threonine dehydratase